MKKTKVLGKKIYLFDQHTFAKVVEVDENNQPVNVEVTHNGNDTVFNVVGKKWIIANSMKKVIDGLINVIQYQNGIIDNYVKDFDYLQLKHPEIFNNNQTA